MRGLYVCVGWHLQLLLLLLLLTLIPAVRALQAVSNQTLLFVSGWPQSGTSLIQQILTVAPAATTMVERCRELLGSKCINWNNEGQWLLGQGPLTPADERYRVMANKVLLPGAMCLPPPDMYQAAISSEHRDKLRSYLLQQWGHFWNSSQERPVLVEKSPQFLLKIPLFLDLFGSSAAQQGSVVPARVKFLVVIKHPATLNNAVPKLTAANSNSQISKSTSTGTGTGTGSGVSDSSNSEAGSSAPIGVMEWTHHTLDGDGDPISRTQPNTRTQKLQNMRFFIDFLGHGSNTSEKNDALHWEKNRRPCSLGWIPAMERLTEHLHKLSADKGRRAIDLRVLRFEQFERPHLVCRALFAFLYDDPHDPRHAEMLSEAITSVCNVHFPLVKTASAGSAYTNLPGNHDSRRVRQPRGQLLGGRRQHHGGLTRRRRMLEIEDIRSNASSCGSSSCRGSGNDGDGIDSQSRRRLRLHAKEGAPAQQLLFRDRTMTRSVYERIQGYFRLYRDPVVPDSIRQEITQLNARIKRFGYLIQPDDINSPSHREPSVLDPWDLMLAYQQHQRPGHAHSTQGPRSPSQTQLLKNANVVSSAKSKPKPKPQPKSQPS